MVSLNVMAAEKIEEFFDGALINAEFVDGELIFTKGDLTELNVGGLVTQSQFDARGPSGRELDYASSTVSQSGIAGTATDLTGLSITFDVVNRPVYVELELPWVTASAAAGAASAIIADAAGVIKRYGIRGFSASEAQTIRCIERITTPGTYTRKAQLQRASGTATFANNFDIAQVVSTLCAVER